jgi:hypothetical protein
VSAPQGSREQKRRDPPGGGEHSRKARIEEADVLDFVEAVLNGVVLLAARFWRTASHYLFRPRLIRTAMSSASGSAAGTYLRPLTFLFVAYLTFVVLQGVDSLGFHPDKVSSFADMFPRFSKIALGAVRDLDANLLLAAAVPLVLAVAAAAAINRYLSRTFGCATRAFKEHLALESYFVGTLLLVEAAVIVALRASDFSPNSVVWAIVMLVGWLFFAVGPPFAAIRAIGCHASVLHCRWVRSFFVCGLAWLLSLVAISPAVLLLQ